MHRDGGLFTPNNTERPAEGKHLIGGAGVAVYELQENFLRIAHVGSEHGCILQRENSDGYST